MLCDSRDGGRRLLHLVAKMPPPGQVGGRLRTQRPESAFFQVPRGRFDAGPGARAACGARVTERLRTRPLSQPSHRTSAPAASRPVLAGGDAWGPEAMRPAVGPGHDAQKPGNPRNGCPPQDRTSRSSPWDRRRRYVYKVWSRPALGQSGDERRRPSR